MNSLGGSKDGKCVLKFKDGGEYHFSHPEMSIEGLSKNDKTQVYYKKAVISDIINDIVGEVTYNPSFNASLMGTGYRYTVGWIPGMNSLGHNKKSERKARADDIEIKILEKNNVKC